MNSDLERSIKSTLALFAAQDEVATLMELQSLLVRVTLTQQSVSLSELLETLEGPLARQVVGHNGLYALKGHEQAIDKRLARYNRTYALLRKARRYALVLRHIPFVRAVALSGSVVQLNASEHSDIDLFIMTKPGRIFLARLLVSAFFQLTGSRRHGRKITARFCLNHYVASDKALPQDRNLYTAMIYSSLFPVFGESFIESFWQKNIFWIKNFLIDPHRPQTHIFPHQSAGSTLQRAFEFLLSPLAPILERIFRYLQTRRIKISEYVIVSDDQLAFHPESKGQRILARYQSVLSATN